MQFVTYHIVVVFAINVPGKLQEVIRSRIGGDITHGQADHRVATFHQQARVKPEGFMIFHIGHAGLASPCEPLPEEARVGGIHGFGRSQPAGIKAEAHGLGFDVCCRKQSGLFHSCGGYSSILNV